VQTAVKRINFIGAAMDVLVLMIPSAGVRSLVPVRRVSKEALRLCRYGACVVLAMLTFLSNERIS
jgi:hypothetical protein